MLLDSYAPSYIQGASSCKGGGKVTLSPTKRVSKGRAPRRRRTTYRRGGQGDILIGFTPLHDIDSVSVEREYEICDYLHGLQNSQNATMYKDEGDTYRLLIKGRSSERGQEISDNRNNQAVLRDIFNALTSEKKDYQFSI